MAKAKTSSRKTSSRKTRSRKPKDSQITESPPPPPPALVAAATVAEQALVEPGAPDLGVSVESMLDDLEADDMVILDHPGRPQKELPTLETKVVAPILEIDKLAHAFYTAQDARLTSAKAESSAKAMLFAKMREHVEHLEELPDEAGWVYRYTFDGKAYIATISRSESISVRIDKSVKDAD